MAHVCACQCKSYGHRGHVVAASPNSRQGTRSKPNVLFAFQKRRICPLQLLSVASRLRRTTLRPLLLQVEPACDHNSDRDDHQRPDVPGPHPAPGEGLTRVGIAAGRRNVAYRVFMLGMLGAHTDLR